MIALDGWNIAVDWFNLFRKDSFFVPSVNWDHDKKAIVASAKEAGCEIAIKGVVEDEIAGLRVWIVQSVI